MTCCASSNADTGRFFSWLADLHRLRHALLGFERSQRHLIDGIKEQGVRGAVLLEVGCGPGYLHQHLLLSGAACAVGVDLSPRMIDAARRNAAARGLREQTDYQVGDFVQLAAELPEADIVILDKVVCCYPDWEAMLAGSLDRARRLVALTYPRDWLLTRAGIRWMSWALGAIGCCYHPYLHDPARIQARIERAGMQKTGEKRTALWITEVYRRQGGQGPSD
jgi:magnesium-protoporphyrin O-methyltransferase